MPFGAHPNVYVRQRKRGDLRGDSDILRCNLYIRDHIAFQINLRVPRFFKRADNVSLEFHIDGTRLGSRVLSSSL